MVTTYADPVVHESPDEAVAKIIQKLESVTDQKDARWMVAVWRIEDGKIVLDKTSYQYPFNDYAASVQLLNGTLKREYDSTAAPPTPLPTAPTPSPVRQLQLKFDPESRNEEINQLAKQQTIEETQRAATPSDSGAKKE